MSPKQQQYLAALAELYPSIYAETATFAPSARISEIERRVKDRWHSKRFPSKQTAVREALLRHAGDSFAAESSLAPILGRNRTLTFKAKDKWGDFTARSMPDQRQALADLIAQERPFVLAYMGKNEPIADEPIADEPIADEPIADELIEQASPWLSPADFLRKHQANRAEMKRRAEVGEPLADVSMRPALDAAKPLYAAGAQWAGDFVLDSYAKTWPMDVRRKMGIEYFDVTAVTDVPAKYADRMPANAHPAINAVLWNVLARNNVYLKGPAGSGKTHLAFSLAEILGVQLGFSPLTDGASYTWLTGSYSLQGYQTRPFVECFRDGGVFLGDEIDGADANMLLVLNSALANDQWSNPVTGEIIAKHADFVFIAAGNTWGMGADATYRGRNALDGATLDRFSAGRIELSYDDALETALFYA